MSTPAERYAAAALRTQQAQSELGAFIEGLSFPLDEFQVRACEAVEAGRGVLVAAPTGAGKTIVGEFAVHLALATGRKAFYTTPIKALSNQKYNDLVRVHGSSNVGLLTGDSSINGEAPVVVMTTEVLRNMMYAGSPTLRGLGFVVMDEVHYLADRFRGPVWEEVIIHLPEDVQVVSLSATVSNAEEFGAWLAEVRGDHEVIVSEHRPVPLWQHMMVGQDLHDLFVDETSAPTASLDATRVNPDLLAAVRRAEQRGRALYDDPYRGRERPGPRGGGRAARAGAWRPRVRRRWPLRGRGDPRGGDLAPRPRRPAAGDHLHLQPGGVRRRGASAAAGRHAPDPAAGGRADPPHRRGAGAVPARGGPRGAGLLGLRRGPHPGLRGPSRGDAADVREIVEELFTAGRIRAVFATETLALGINMPARTVVIEKLVKFNGETHADITPAEYTQLTGRAGRRGIDIEGHAVVLWNRSLDPLAVAGLASTRTYPLRSSFRPTYNMAVNLVAQVGREVAREILETSFAQFQADRAVVGMARAVRRNEEGLEGYAEAMQCHLGDFTGYAALRNEIRHLEKEGAKNRAASKRAEAALSLEALRIGDVIRIPTGRRAGYAVVVQPSKSYRGEPASPTVLTEDKQIRRLTLVDVPVPVEALTRVKVPPHFNAKSPKSRKDLATSLRIAVPHEPPPRKQAREAAEGDEGRIAELRRQMKAHPCHQCPDREEHARWAERWWRLKRETVGLQRKVEGRTNTVAKTFDRICTLLGEMAYLSADGTAVTPRARTCAACTPRRTCSRRSA